MKQTRKLLAMLLCIVMVLGMATTVFATETASTKGTIINSTKRTYNAYQIFSGTQAENGVALGDIAWGTGIDSAAFLVALKTLEVGEDTPFAECASAADVAGVLAGVSDNSDIAKAFANLAVQYLTEESVAVAAKTAEENVSVTLASGYYLLVDTSEGNAAQNPALLQVTKGDLTITDKSDAPTLEKKIQEGNALVDANNGSIGDTVNYVLTSRVPDMGDYNKYFFVIHDTLSDGLSFNADSVGVQIGTTTLAEADFDVITEGLEDDCTFEIVLKNFIQYKDMANAIITITYNATIDVDAVIGNVGNPNSVHLEYSNNPNVEYEGDGDNEDKPGDDDVTGVTPEDHTITYVTAIELVKVDGLTGDRLTGAKFKITGQKINKVKIVTETFTAAEDGTYYKLKDGSYTTEEPKPETADKYVEAVDWN